MIVFKFDTPEDGGYVVLNFSHTPVLQDPGSFPPVEETLDIVVPGRS